MVDPNINEATVVDQVINAIWDGFAIRNGEIIIHIDGRLLPFGLPFLLAVLEVPDQLFLLAIDGNDWLPFGFKGFPGAIETPYRVVCTGRAFQRRRFERILQA